MHEDITVRPFPVEPYGEIGGRHVADCEPQTSTSAGGHRRIEGVLRHLARSVGDLEEWWQDAQPSLAGDLDPEARRRVLRHARATLGTLPLILESFERALTDIAAANAVADADDDFRGLLDQAVRWNFAWTFRQEQEAAALRHPLDDPKGFLGHFKRGLRAEV
jgi:hypothetical protein